MSLFVVVFGVNGVKVNVLGGISAKTARCLFSYLKCREELGLALRTRLFNVLLGDDLR